MSGRFPIPASISTGTATRKRTLTAGSQRRNGMPTRGPYAAFLRETEGRAWEAASGGRRAGFCGRGAGGHRWPCPGASNREISPRSKIEKRLPQGGPLVNHDGSPETGGDVIPRAFCGPGGRFLWDLGPIEYRMFLSTIFARARFDRERPGRCRIPCSRGQGVQTRILPVPFRNGRPVPAGEASLIVRDQASVRSDPRPALTIRPVARAGSSR